MELKERIAKLEAELNELKAELDKKEYCLNVFTEIPKYDEEYYYVSSNGVIKREISNDSRVDKAYCENSILFKDKKSAETYKELRSDMKRLSKEFKLCESNYYVYYNHVNEEVKIYCSATWEENDYYFTKENAQLILDKYGQEVLKNYILYCK